MKNGLIADLNLVKPIGLLWGELGNAVFIAMWILIEKKQNNKRLPMPGNLFVSGSACSHVCFL